MKKLFKMPFLLTALTLFVGLGCSGDEEPVETVSPEIKNVTSEENVEVSLTGIVISGSIDYKNPNNLIAYGVVWSTEPNPDINDNVIDESSGNSSAETRHESIKSTDSGNISFTTSITDLFPNQDYYFKIFATTPEGTFYGEQMSYSTLSLAGTKWKFLFLHDYGRITWTAIVDFYEDGTAFYTEPDFPGVYDVWGIWSVEGDQLYYDMQGDGNETSYILTGTVDDDLMEGTYTWGEENYTWVAGSY